jgi:hypothetical protein
LLQYKEDNRKNDQFAEIAARGMNYRNGLVIPDPPQLDEKFLPLNGLDKEAVFTPLKKMNSKEELYEELKRQRTHYDRFLQNMAPSLEEVRIKKEITEAQWRIQTEEDLQDFQGVIKGGGSWESIKLPHYGGPLGKETSYYRTSFQLSKDEFDAGALFICFKAVDYKAHIFINGAYLGSHEGFFAPFEFDFTSQAIKGENILVVVVENDFICGGSISERFDGQYTGDKIYAATGIGYDDPKLGWHHCPPGMGMYQEVTIEVRPRIHIKDVFVRPILDENRAEAWIEVYSCDIAHKEVSLKLSLYGQNFDETVFEALNYKPVSNLAVGLGDSLTEAKVKAEGKLNSAITLYMEKGINYLKIPFEINNPRVWDIETPWLYQLQIKLLDKNEKFIDSYRRQFGMRSFVMEEESEPKGRFLLNGRPIKLRGANTMGHEQQCVFKKDWEQLISDILLAKICNMNFLRINQRPVQQEVYDYCDKLGLMTQTDLPLFGVLRRNQFVEAVRQAGEMEHLVRSHPCNIIVSYINEPFPNASNKPHRHLLRDELEEFFKAADIIVRLNNPDRVIKRVDGDYDPPGPGLPDNHCYPCWYNGHGIDVGKLNKGYWMYVKPGWHYGCGEFGAEGLDPVEVMRKYYPEKWLPKTKPEEKIWSPSNIIGAQSGNFHYFFYETPNSLEEWVKESHKHQAWATKVMTEAFRRNVNMNTFAIHLFIDAFPSGWMKTIMDVERNPKPAYFAYREALTPLMTNIRSDRNKFFSEEEVKLEAWICNDRIDVLEDLDLCCQVEIEGKVAGAYRVKAEIPSCSSTFQGYISFKAPKVLERITMIVRLGLVNEQGTVLQDSSTEVEIFPVEKWAMETSLGIVGEKHGSGSVLAKEIGTSLTEFNRTSEVKVVLAESYEIFKEREAELLSFVKKGGRLIFLELIPGCYEIFGSRLEVKNCGMLPLHFVSRNTGHPMVEGFKSDDFKLWYDSSREYITPLLEATFTSEDFKPILTSGNVNSKGQWDKVLAVGEMRVGTGNVVICQLKLAGRTEHNPIARRFAYKLISKG